MTEQSQGSNNPVDTYRAAVLDVVRQIPAGRVMTYGLLAEVVGETLAMGGPRQVGAVLAAGGDDVPWWRVVNASGGAHASGLGILRDEGCPLTGDGARVAVRRAIWWPGVDR